MKKVLVTVLLFGAGLLALRAQTTKGTWAFGLHNFSPVSGTMLLAPTSSIGLAFGTHKSESPYSNSEVKSKYTFVGLNGSAHYFLFDHFSGGVQLNFLTQTEKEDGADGDKYTITLFMAGPELRDYIPVSEKISIWLKGGAAFGTAQTKYNGDSQGDPSKLSRFGGGAGVAIFPNPHVSIDIGADYSAYISKETDTNFSGVKQDYKDTTSGVAIDLGFTVFF